MLTNGTEDKDMGCRILNEFSGNKKAPPEAMRHITSDRDYMQAFYPLIVSAIVGAEREFVIEGSGCNEEVQIAYQKPSLSELSTLPAEHPADTLVDSKDGDPAQKSKQLCL